MVGVEGRMYQPWIVSYVWLATGWVALSPWHCSFLTPATQPVWRRFAGCADGLVLTALLLWELAIFPHSWPVYPPSDSTVAHSPIFPIALLACLVLIPASGFLFRGERHWNLLRASNICTLVLAALVGLAA